MFIQPKCLNAMRSVASEIRIREESISNLEKKKNTPKFVGDNLHYEELMAKNIEAVNTLKLEYSRIEPWSKIEKWADQRITFEVEQAAKKIDDGSITFEDLERITKIQAIGNSLCDLMKKNLPHSGVRDVLY